jgi:murein hydrolase activator
MILRTLRTVLLVAAVGLALPGRAADPAADAIAAADALRGAITALQTAAGAKDRVAALTQTIGAYEQGLAALRDSLRRAAVREAAIHAAFEARRDRIGQVLGAMTAFGQVSAPLLLVHPNGPEDTVRSSLVLSSVAPALQAEADALARDLRELATLQSLQGEVSGMLQDGLVAAQTARTALSQAMQDRTDLPTRFIDDPEELKTLVGDAATLDAFAIGLSSMETDIGPPMDDFAGARGSLPLPVLGRLLYRAGQADAAGIARPGMILATAPEALVTAPWPATIRYRGPLLDYGNVMILEPADGYLLVLAGLGTVYGETGDVLAAGAPVGLMPARAAPLETDGATDTGGAGRTETLYMELRQGEEPVDPGEWFTETKG